MQDMLQDLIQSVFATLGPGHSEAAYCRALGVGLQHRNIKYEYEKTISVDFEGAQVGTCRLDLVVGDLIIEVKCVAAISSSHRQQIGRYLKLLGLERGLLINFGPVLDMEYVLVK